MTEGKLAAQAIHAVLGLPAQFHDSSLTVKVLKASDAQFYHALQDSKDKMLPYYVHKDLGLTEVKKDTETCLAVVIHEYSS